MFQFAAIKAKLLDTALNAGIMLAASLAIQGIATELDNYIHRVEKAREKTEEINDRINDINSEYKSHADLVKNVAERYEELSKGVNSADNSNRSLSDDEYTEFLDISSQLVDAFPELYKGLDENGSAILNIGTSAQSASEFLQELIEKEEHLANAEISNELDELYRNVSIQMEDAQKSMSKYDEELSRLDEAWKNAQTMNIADILGLDQLEVGDNAELQNAVSKSIQQFQNELYAQLEKGEIDADSYLNFVEQFVNPALYEEGTLFDGYVNLMSLDNNQKQRLQEIIRGQTETLMEELEDSVGTVKDNISLEQQNFDAIWADFIPSLVAGMKSKANFKKLEEAGLGDFAASLVESLDSGIIGELKGTDYEDDIYGYVRSKILVPLKNAITDESGKTDAFKLENVKKQISDALDLKDAFNQSDVPLDAYMDQVNALISVFEELGMAPDIIKNIKILFNYDDVSDIQKRMDNSINAISGYRQDDFGRGLNSRQTLEEKKKLQDYINSLTAEEYQLWLEVTSGIQGAQNAIDAFEKELENAGSIQLDPVSNSELIDSFSEMTTSLKSVSDILDGIKAKEPLDLSLLDTSNFKGFEGLEEELSKFINTVAAAPDNMEAAQTAADELVDSYIRQEKFVSLLRDGNKELAISMLEQTGVTNAAVIVEQELEKQEADLYLQKQNIVSIIQDENAFTEERIQELFNEAEANGIAADAIVELIAQEILLNEQGLDLSSQIDELYRLALRPLL